MLKKIIDILAIVLPALIILLGITRLFVQKTKGVNGLIMFFAILLLLIGLMRYFFFPGGNSTRESGPKTAPISVNKHSDSFNRSLENILAAYYKLVDGFVKNDTTIINRTGSDLKVSLDSLNLDELKKDSSGIYESAVDPLANAKTEVASITSDPSMVEKRGSLNILSDDLRNLLIVVKYDRSTLNWQECDKAFGEDRPGNWISLSETSPNPYGQLDCAEVRATINFVPVDTTKKQ